MDTDMPKDHPGKTGVKSRKGKSRDKRKEAGLIPKEVYLHQEVYDRFELLAEQCRHKKSARGLSSDQLSMLVLYLLDWYEKPKGVDISLTYKGQYLYRVHQMLKYLYKEFGGDIGQIVAFMRRMEHPIPQEIPEFSGKIKGKDKYDWSDDQVATLLNSKFIYRIIYELNNDSEQFMFLINDNPHEISLENRDKEDKLEQRKLVSTDVDLNFIDMRKKLDDVIKIIFGENLDDDEFFETTNREKIDVMKEYHDYIIDNK